MLGDKTLTQTLARSGEARRGRRSRMAEDMADFLRWWKSSLVSTLPTGLTNAYSTRRQSVYIYQKDDAWCAGIPSRPELGCISENRRLRRRVAASDPVLLLEPHEVLVRRRRMPVASLNRLAHAMRLQIPAETPFDLQEIYTATRIAGDPDTDGTVLVEQAIVKCDLADARLAEILSLEIDLAGADILDEDGNPCGFNLLPPEKCARQGAFLPTVNRVFGFVALALTAALATSWYVDLSREAAQVEKAAADSGQIARQVLQLQASAQSDVATIQQIDAVISNPGRFAAAYAAVTEALGDDTWPKASPIPAIPPL